MENKYIHYCWFGDNPFPKLGKKCLNSWKKYLPDYKIMLWTEENVDLEECAFIKEAYANKKWAFVADYVRAKVLKEYGGLYFDTDMEVIKPIDHLFEDDTFLGIEDTGYVAVGVWYEKYPNALLPTKLYDLYRSFETFSIEQMRDITIPKLLTGVLDKFGFVKGSSEIQHLKNNIAIYPRDYFYPYSYYRNNNVFTDNTCMIHYYDASWLPFKERIENDLIRRFGAVRAQKILTIYRRIFKLIFFPLWLYKKHKLKYSKIDNQYLERINNTIKEISKNKNKSYVAIHNNDWLGVTSATKELFKYTIDCPELYRKKEIDLISDKIIESNIKQVIFSSFAIGYKDLVLALKKKNSSILIKVYWHGSHSQILDSYGFERYLEFINLHKENKIDAIASCKESLGTFYKNQNFNSFFLTNKVVTNVIPEKNKKSDKIRIGLYAADCSNWRKNIFNQIAAVANIDNVILDIAPLNDTIKEFTLMLGIEVDGVEGGLKREDLLKRMSLNDLNLYVTFSECAPMLPLESFEMGVVCITGNNHHYFKDTELEKYLVVNNEDDPEEIKEKILLCLSNKKKILKLYEEFKENNIKLSKKQLEEFINEGVL